MHCRNIFCIYQKEDVCLIAQEARLDDWGVVLFCVFG